MDRFKTIAAKLGYGFEMQCKNIISSPSSRNFLKILYLDKFCSHTV